MPNILNLIGRTPLVRLKTEPIYAKAEFLNPGGSIKDRVALAMIEGAERDGRLRPDSIIVEPSSGNTGIGIALVGRLEGYQVRTVAVEPKNVSALLGHEPGLQLAKAIQGNIATVLPDRAERYFSTALM